MGGAPTPEGVYQPINWQNICKNCMKIKEFGLRGDTHL